MSDREKNVVASVLARLRNKAKSSDAPFQQILQQYAIERLLYRVSKSIHAQSVILKGALLLKTIGIPSARPTKDIDMLRTGKSNQASLLALVKDCASLEAGADGLAFLADTVTAENITKDSGYTGTPILMDARMDNVRLRIQIDFGVGDVMVPGPRMSFCRKTSRAVECLRAKHPRAPTHRCFRHCHRGSQGLRGAGAWLSRAWREIYATVDS